MQSKTLTFWGPQFWVSYFLRNTHLACLLGTFCFHLFPRKTKKMEQQNKQFAPRFLGTFSVRGRGVFGGPGGQRRVAPGGAGRPGLLQHAGRQLGHPPGGQALCPELSGRGTRLGGQGLWEGRREMDMVWGGGGGKWGGGG